MTLPDMDITSTISLAGGGAGVRIPRLGFGVYQSPPAATQASVLAALRAGYRHIDTAQYYANEAQVGAAVRASGVAREHVFVTTKVLACAGSVAATLARCRASVAAIGLGAVDLFLVHSPSCGPAGRRELWLALEQLRADGGARAIGVSN